MILKVVLSVDMNCTCGFNRAAKVVVQLTRSLTQLLSLLARIPDILALLTDA